MAKQRIEWIPLREPRPRVENVDVQAPGIDEELDLVERHRHGDPGAFEEVHARYADLVYNLALRLSGSPDLAQDLSQEVFIRIYRGLGRFRGRSSLKTWIFRVCLNHCRSRLKRRRPPVEPLRNAEGEEVDVPDPSRGPEALAMAEEAAARLACSLPHIRPSFREAVVLRDLEGLSYQEIASVLRVRIGTVRSRIARGREQLRALLEKQGGY